MRELRNWLAVLALLATAAALVTVAFQGAGRAPELSSRFQAVALANGQVYFGRIEGLASDYPVLRDVFYIQARQNPETKEVANVLIKRGAEAHGPDRMLLSRQQIVLIEPVKDDSQIGRLIAEQIKSR